MEGTNTYHYLLVVQTNSGTRGKPIVVYELTTIGYCYEPIVVHASTNTGRPADLYEVVAPRREKSCGRVADKFGLRTWTINLRTWIFGFTCLVFKTTCIDRRIPLRVGAFFFTRTMLFPPLDKRNTRDKARGLCITSEGYIRELGVRCLSTLNREQDSHATVSYRSARQPIIGCFAPIHRGRSIPDQERGIDPPARRDLPLPLERTNSRE